MTMTSLNSFTTSVSTAKMRDQKETSPGVISFIISHLYKSKISLMFTVVI